MAQASADPKSPQAQLSTPPPSLEEEQTGPQNPLQRPLGPHGPSSEKYQPLREAQPLLLVKVPCLGIIWSVRLFGELKGRLSSGEDGPVPGAPQQEVSRGPACPGARSCSVWRWC